MATILKLTLKQRINKFNLQLFCQQIKRIKAIYDVELYKVNMMHFNNKYLLKINNNGDFNKQNYLCKCHQSHPSVTLIV